MSLFTFPRQKYLDLYRTQGISTALTTLQTDIVGWEYESFEGKKGYNPQMWTELERARTFARELWDLALAELK